MAAARDHFEAALVRDPNNAMARLWSGINLFSLGYLQRAQMELEAALAIDPMVGVSNFWLGFVLVSRGETDRGLESVLRAQALGFPVGDALVARARAFDGDLEAAAVLMARFYDARPDRDEARVARDAAVVAAIRDPSLMDPELGELWVSVLAGQIDEGLAVSRAEWGAVTTTGMWGADTLVARERPLFFEIMTENGYVDLWEADGYPDGCAPVADPEPRLDCSQ
jgi:tetratricopeptide (TPR) repeat protein